VLRQIFERHAPRVFPRTARQGGAGRTALKREKRKGREQRASSRCAAFGRGKPLASCHLPAAPATQTARYPRPPAFPGGPRHANAIDRAAPSPERALPVVQPAARWHQDRVAARRGA